jgi:glycosyltransferase involved in cell wall biosynthesis
MTVSMPEVAVLMPTLGLRERADSFRRAVDSVLTQEGVRSRLILVVNGGRHDPALLAAHDTDPQITMVERREPGIAAALEAGRALVRSPWTATLDDDDVLLPGALRARVETLERHPEAAVVVSNGFRRSAQGDRLHIPDLAALSRDPLGALLERNWLLPGAWLFRTAAMPADLFLRMPAHFECTYLAVRFATSGRLVFLDAPTVAWSTDTPGSAAKSRAYRMGEVPALQQILRLPLPAGFRAGLERNLAAACHRQSDESLEAGDLRGAWRWHLASLAGRGGLRYLPYTGHLLAGRRRPGA